MPETTGRIIQQAAEAIAGADALLIGARAGMGVDSGLPDFRGSQGFWRVYPLYARLGLGFTALANPCWFRDDPALAWGFYGHRLGLYRRTRPHSGFDLLRDWADRMSQGGFVYTSNVDGQFHASGFDPDRVVEAHGSIHWMQCTAGCGVGVFPADPFEVIVEEATMRAIEPLPKCFWCDEVAQRTAAQGGPLPARDHSGGSPHRAPAHLGDQRNLSDSRCEGTKACDDRRDCQSKLTCLYVY